MTFDATRYEREVLEPGLRRDSTPPADLLARYANPPLVPGPAFDSHVDEVRRHWRRLAHSQKYARLAAALLIADKQLREEVRRAAGDQDARLDGPRLKWLAQEQRRQAQAALVTEARSIAPASACVSPATVEALVERSDGLVDPVEVGRILEEAGVRVVEPLPLPERPPTPKHREVERHLRALGLRLSPEAVFGAQVRAGFRALGGFHLTSDAGRFDAGRIAEQRRKLEMAARDERETVRSKLLLILEEVGRHQDHLDDLVLWELAELLRKEPAVLSQRALAAAVVALGLDRAEADVLALSVIESRSPRGMAADVLEEVEEALLEGRLRGAERLAAGLPEDDDGRRLRERVSQVARTVSSLMEAAERQLSRGGFEETAGLLGRAVALA